MKKISSVIWGIVLIAAGALFALNALNITNIDIFFDGWWTLFIIVPCAVGLFTEREKTGNIIGIAVGVFLLLCCQDILSFSMLWKLLIPAIIVIMGLKMVFTGLFGNKANEIIAKIKQNGGETKVGCATFSGCDLNYDGEVFEGAELSATWRKTIGDFTYSIGGNVSYSKNRIVEAAEGHVPYEWQRIAGTQIGEMYGYEPVGFYQQEDFNADGSLKEGVVASGLISTLRPGDVKYNDLNEDGVIDENDAKYHGVSYWPSLYYGINIGMEYKNFGFQAMFQGAGNFMVYTNLANVYQPLYNNDKNISKHYLESYWSAQSPQGRYPRLTTESNAHNYANSPVWWERGDYLKLRNLYVWYDFGQYIDKIDSFRLFFRGNNLFSIDNVKIMDPEHVSLAYPTARSFQLGLKLTF